MKILQNFIHFVTLLFFYFKSKHFINQELSQLQHYLRPHWKKYRMSEIKTKYKHLMGWIPNTDDIPDFWIEPKNSLLVELLANEIVPCQDTKFSAGYTVRFPRLINIYLFYNLFFFSVLNIILL